MESASKRVSSLENEFGLVSERKKDLAQKNTHFETYTSSPFKWKINAKTIGPILGGQPLKQFPHYFQRPYNAQIKYDQRELWTNSRQKLRMDHSPKNSPK
jgi:hypothetical protein